MVRYIKQKNDYSCSAVVLMNARKWQGEKISYAKHYPEYRKKLLLTPELTEEDYWTRWLMLIQEISRIGGDACIRPTVKRVERMLTKGYAVMVYEDCDEKEYAHIYIIVKQTEKSFYCVNFDYEYAHKWVKKPKIFDGREVVVWSIPTLNKV